MRYAWVMQAAAAIADPVRREILELLQGGPATAGVIAERFPISRPAISRHLRVLRECGLVHDRVQGRQRVYSLDPNPLREIGSWIKQFTGSPPWDQRLDALQTEVSRTRLQRLRASTSDARPHNGGQLHNDEEIA